MIAELGVSLERTAEELFETHPNKDEHIAAMVKWFNANRSQIDQDEATRLLCKLLVERVRHGQNRKIRGATDPGAQARFEARRRATHNGRREIMVDVCRYMMWTVAGTVLAHCSKDMLMKEAGDNRRKGAGNIANAIWFEKIAARLKDGETVADKWNEDKLAKLRNQAEAEAAGLVGL